MTSDDRNAIQAAIEQMCVSISELSRALMLDETDYPNAVLGRLNRGKDAIQSASEWIDRALTKIPA